MVISKIETNAELGFIGFEDEHDFQFIEKDNLQQFKPTFMKYCFSLFICLVMLGCSSPGSEHKANSNNSQQIATVPVNQAAPKPLGAGSIKAILDQSNLSDLTDGVHNKNYKSVFDYYRHRKEEDDYDVWTENLFGRCCTEADLLYSETLQFSISSDIKNPKYPASQLTDTWFTKAYAFKDTQSPKIDIRVDLKTEDTRRTAYGIKQHKEVLKAEDTIAYPFNISLVNGYTKSVDLYKANARVKELKVFHNDQPKGTVLLMDSPEIQRFSLDLAFLKNDVITLQPISFFKGLKFDDVCISEIQSCVCESGHQSINQKYSAYEDK